MYLYVTDKFLYLVSVWETINNFFLQEIANLNVLAKRCDKFKIYFVGMVDIWITIFYYSNFYICRPMDIKSEICIGALICRYQILSK